jgi:DNA polymerase I
MGWDLVDAVMATRLFEPASPGVLYVIDLSGYVFRAYHAIAPLTSPTGEPTHAVFGTVNMLERLVRQQKPALLCVAMDSRKKTFRKEIYPEYKANRPPAPEDLPQQMKRCREIIDAFGISVFQEDGVEADDLIASAVRRAREENLKVIIVSADKDLTQLVGDDVLMWDTVRDRVFGPPEVEERYGVGPGQMRDLLALMGDSSDNIPGVPSVGPKTARDLLNSYGTLEGVYEHLGEVKRKKLKENLEANHDKAILSQTLVTLKEDCVLDFDLEKLAYRGRALDTLRSLYTELGFTRHITAVDREAAKLGGPAATTSSSAGPGKASDPAADTTGTTATNTTQVERHYSLLTKPEELAELAKGIAKAERIAIAVQTRKQESTREPLVGLAVALQPGKACYVPVGHSVLTSQLTIDAVKKHLGPVLAGPKVTKTCHDLKFTEVVLKRAGLNLAGGGFDTLLAGYLLDPDTPHTAEALAQRHLGLVPADATTVSRGGGRKARPFDELTPEELSDFVCERADVALRLEEPLRVALDEQLLTKLLEDVELPLASILTTMELDGVLVDTAALETLGKQVEKDLTALEAKAHEIAGDEFNVHSPRQLETLLFDKLGLKPLKRTKTARSTDAATLEALADEHELPKLILEIRQLAKLKSTYIDALPQLVEPQSGRIHTQWRQAVAATGRLSSTDPNLQNIPVRTELGRSIRAAFIAPPKHEIVSADYSQIELRVLAHLSQDPVLIEAFRSGEDIHSRTAMEIFEVSKDELTPEHRRQAKAVNFGVIYGQGDRGLAKSLGIPRMEASSFIAAYFRRYEGVREFMERTLVEARAGGRVRTILERQRLIPELTSGNRARRLAAERIAMNAPIQGSAADILKLAMLKLKDPVTPGSRMVMTVHDELVFEVPEDEVEEAMAAVKVAMEGAYPLDVPLEVDVGHAGDWRDAH